MAARHFILTQEEILSIEESIRDIDNNRTRNRIRAVLLYGTNALLEDILNEMNCSRDSLMKWVRHYRNKGIQGLMDRRLGGNRTKLSQEQKEDLSKRLKQYAPWMVLGSSCSTPEGRYWNAKDTLRAIEIWYGVKYKSRTSFYVLLKSSGIELEELITQTQFHER